MTTSGFLSRDELQTLGLASFGSDVLISRKASIYGAARIDIGSHVRIDDYCVVSAGEGGVSIGSFVHIAAMCGLYGSAQISVGDFAGMSSRTALYSSADDFAGGFLAGPAIPEDLRNVVSRPITMEKHALIGTGSTVLPGAILKTGAVVGAMSLVIGTLDEFWVYHGVPARPVRARGRMALELERECRRRFATTP